jgi:hypothetical protein
MIESQIKFIVLLTQEKVTVFIKWTQSE